MIASLVKRLVALTPYRISRRRENRFDATHSCLLHFREMGYVPSLIIDGGAHLGAFAEAAHKTFPEAELHLIEPQPACRAPLETLTSQRGWVFHACALSDHTGTVRMACDVKPSTGAYVATTGEATVDVPAATIDSLLGAHLNSGHHALLKLDLQGHELRALRGAETSLPKIDVALVEVSFFQQGAPTIPEIVSFFDEKGFDLFDIVGLAGRTRDGRLRQGDFVFVRRGSLLSADNSWV
jgi:FkbM family methyltransferase